VEEGERPATTVAHEAPRGNEGAGSRIVGMHLRPGEVAGHSGTKSGAWKLCDGPDANWENGGCRPAVLSPDRSVRGLLVLEQGHYETISLDLVLPVLHGKLGEDGAMQGLLELSGIPYVGCDVQSSALCMDKSLAYIVARNVGIATPNFWTVTANENIDPAQLTYPVFVKPARSGSSFGVSKVSRKEELLNAVETATQYDSKALIEEAVVGSEVGCAILGNDLDLIVGEVDRISLSHGFFRIHQENEPESGSENSTPIVPADISTESRSLVQETAKVIYRALGCRGLSRVDMFLKEDGTVVLNEVNTFAWHDLIQPLPENDESRRISACRTDRPDGVVGIDREVTMDDNFVFVDELVPGIRWDAKYATWDNFIGKPVDGYLANRVVGTRALCAALERAQGKAEAPWLRSASVGWLSPATRRRLLSALVTTAGGWSDEATTLSEYRKSGDV
jgi:D-alanine--(R)-lactate ligase